MNNPCPYAQLRALLNKLLDHLILIHEIVFVHNDIKSPITGEVICTWHQVHTDPLATLDHIANLLQQNRALPSYRCQLVQRQPWYWHNLCPIERAVARNLARRNQLHMDIDPLANLAIINIHTARFN